MKKRVLIVDDEPNIRRILEVAFEREGIQAIGVEGAQQAIDELARKRVDCVLTDVTMPGMTGYDLLRELRLSHPETPVVIMTAYGTIPQAVQAIRDGAFEFVTKPFDLDSLKKVVKSAFEADMDQASPGKPAKKKKAKGPQKTAFIAESQVMKDIHETIKQVADARATVLITGESGTGKEVVAKLLHELSPRHDQPFVALSCAALPETLLESELFGYEKGAFTGANADKKGKFEAADGGTLFLDEIGEVPLTIQAKLLRVLQEREFERLGSNVPTKIDVRLVTATNRDLQEMVDAGTFRLDLLYRLQVIELQLPPLRERVDDIRPIAEHFLRAFSEENGRQLAKIGKDALEALQSYAWPGNIRELGNTIERAVVLAGKDDTELGLKHLPQALKKVA